MLNSKKLTSLKQNLHIVYPLGFGNPPPHSKIHTRYEPNTLELKSRSLKALLCSTDQRYAGDTYLLSSYEPKLMCPLALGFEFLLHISKHKKIASVLVVLDLS